MAKRSSPSILKHRRVEVEARIEEMIALLDLLDGDCDLEENGDTEPSLGAGGLLGPHGREYDLEGDNSDDEYTLGWANPQLGKYERPEGWSPIDGENGGSSMPFYEGGSFNGDGHRIGRKLLREHVKDKRKLAKALDATRVSIGYGRFV